MAELLASSAIRPPVVASAINSGGELEKRLKMMIAQKCWKVPAVLRLAIVAIATCVLPLGLINAQDFDAVERRLGGAVESGELTLEQAQMMMKALRKTSEAGNKNQSHQKLKLIAKEIEAAVKSGKMSKEDAKKKMAELKQRMAIVADQDAKKHEQRTQRSERIGNA